MMSASCAQRTLESFTFTPCESSAHALSGFLHGCSWRYFSSDPEGLERGAGFYKHYLGHYWKRGLAFEEQVRLWAKVAK